MKNVVKITFIAIIVFCSSCAIKLSDRNEEIRTFAIDFRPYADQGFLFMPDEYFGEYEVLGMVTTELHPTVNYKKGKHPKGRDYMVYFFYVDNQVYSQLVRDVSIQDLIEWVYQLSIETGGDAFTHFESSIEQGRTDEHPYTSYSYYAISGVIIKRK